MESPIPRWGRINADFREAKFDDTFFRRLTMDRNTCQQFFLHPGAIGQSRYEVLRAVFVDEETTLDVAERFSLSQGTVRNWVSQFGAQSVGWF
jgi:hypothetical protein